MQVLADLILERHVAKGANEVPLQPNKKLEKVSFKNYEIVS